ncbi:MAG: DUF92 domain-containing protein [Silvibacterium sp.]|nr:DUF92 domain-containing protein [Silvibacterium sp.]MBV8437169.1 DUF92 domain-containing protein [Silvibacterium sp.]
MNARTSQRPRLHWQSKLILLIVVPVAGAFASVETMQRWPFAHASVLTAYGIAAPFALLVWILRAATPAAALTGGLFTVILYLWTPGWRTMLWPLLALFLLTFAATRFGRHRKEMLGVAEEKRGRTASQVVANLGAAVIAAIPLRAWRVWLGIYPGRVALIAAIAALGEATADTLSSELGEVLGGEPYLLTTFQRVPSGTDGAISLNGTIAGAAGAAAITIVAAFVFRLSAPESAIAFAAAIIGLFVDSLLGATLERWGWINNDAVNALSTAFAAILARLLAERM